MCVKTKQCELFNVITFVNIQTNIINSKIGNMITVSKFTKCIMKFIKSHRGQLKITLGQREVDSINRMITISEPTVYRNYLINCYLGLGQSSSV
jgi:hypothetical protein